MSKNFSETGFSHVLHSQHIYFGIVIKVGMNHLSFVSLVSILLPCVCQIRVLSPLSLEEDLTLDNGVIYGTTAIFGAPEYGRRALGEVSYYKPSKDHCEGSDFDKYPTREDGATHDMKIYLVDRGGCAFEKKVRLAQTHGADAVIVVDFPCSVQREIAIKEDHPDTPCRDTEAIQRIIMADTSGARDIHIPSILIPRVQGERLIAAVTASETSSSTGDRPSSDKDVVVMLLWDIPRADYVSVDFWMSSAATDTSFFLSEFKEYAQELGQLIQFTPHYSLSKFSRTNVFRPSSCLKSGDSYFCDSQMSSLGQAVVKEDLRQLCVWHSTSKTESVKNGKSSVTHSTKYWDYVSEFFENCHPSRNLASYDPFNDECSETVMRNVGVPIDDVNWCMSNLQPPICRDSSVKKPQCIATFNLLEDQAAHQAWSPHALRINGWRYSGPLEASVVLKTICQGFSQVPDICSNVPSLTSGNYYRGISAGLAWFLAISLLAVIALTFYVYRRNLKHTLRSVLREEVMLEVRSQMADYAMLAEDEESAGHWPKANKVLEMTRFTPQQLPSKAPRE